MESRTRDPSPTRPDTAYPWVLAAPPVRRFRPELQGLRALAVGLVVVYHVWLDRISGGVDVFFVISGFLLTGQLVRAAERGRVELRARWSRTLVRLLPSAAVVLATTAAACVIILPEARWAQSIREVVAAAFFVENWQLAADSVDYAARSNMTSVVQHFWSLSIQGQVFLVWPLLFALIGFAARRRGAPVRSCAASVLVALFVMSLTYSVALTAENQALAYFHSLTRVWEFALGGLLALGVDRVALPLWLRVSAGWTGVLGLVACGLLLRVDAVFPGFAALWPTSCAVLVLLAGDTGAPWAVDRLLTSRPVQYLGNLSYPLYLWHWPLLVLFLAAGDTAGVGLLTGTALIGVSVLLAALTHHAVEQPFLRRHASPRGGYRLAVVAVCAVLVTTGGWQLVAMERAIPSGAIGDPQHPGAAALTTGAVAAAAVLPPPVSVHQDWVRTDGWTCAAMARSAEEACTLPSEGPAAKRVVVVGDSHVQQLSGALVGIARQQHWQLTTILRGACPFSTVSEADPADEGCTAWLRAASAEIDAMHPDVVVTLASRDVREGRTEQTPQGFVDQWRHLDQEGIRVIALRDNPRFGFSVPDCVAQNPDDLRRCGVDRADIYPAVPPYEQRSDVPPNVTFIDTADALCGQRRCPAEIGNVLVYLDDNHLSATYATSMTALLRPQVLAAVSG